MDKSSVQDKAVLSLIKMLDKQKYIKFALSLQIHFEESFMDDATYPKIKDLLLQELSFKGDNNFNITDFGNQFECNMMPEIKSLNVSHNQLFAILEISHSKEGLCIIKNIVSGINNTLQGKLVAKRVGIAINYKWNYKKNMAKDKTQIKQFVISAKEILEDKLNFNIIMQEEALEKIVAFDLFVDKNLAETDLISTIDIIYNNAVNNYSLEKLLLKLSQSK